MTTFTATEIEFLNSQRLGRLATVGADGMPHVVPVAVFYDPEAEALVIGANAQFGESVMSGSKKFRDARRQPKVAVVLDDPGPHVLEVRGHAETHLEGGGDLGRRLGTPFTFSEPWILIRPQRIITMGLSGEQFGSAARNVA
jgi:pyridoxamine 5'-phosphate oxidase family protein